MTPQRLALRAVSLGPAVLLTAAPLVTGMAYALHGGYVNGAADLYALAALPLFKSSISFSLCIALVTSGIAALSGTVLAYLFCEKIQGHLVLAKVLVMLPYLAAASLVANAFGDSGLVAHLVKAFYPSLRSLGIRYHPLGLGVIITCLYKQIPFVFLTMAAVFFDIRTQFQETARTLGLGGWDMFWRVFLPLGRRPFAGVLIMIFQFTLFSYEGFAFLGPSAPKGLGELLVLLYYSADSESKSLAMTLCGIEFAASFISAIVLALVMLYGKKKER
jgi:putative spermidine/putrescine transport system permease protein